MGPPECARYGIAIGDILDFIALLRTVAPIVEIIGNARGCDDPDDDPVIETAEVGAVDYLITGDTTLLNPRITASLGQIGIEVITAGDFLRNSYASPPSIDQPRIIVAMKSMLALPRAAKSGCGVRLGLRCSGTAVC